VDRIAEVDRPTPKDNQVLVKVHATTVNRTDCGFRAGKPFFVRALTGLSRPRVTVLGTEFAGEVEAVGHSVASFAVGDRVFGFKGLPFGAHAEYMTIPEDGFLATMPAQLSFEEAAHSTEGSHYALALIRRAKVRSGQDVLVYGATGAIGSAAVQLVLDAVGKSSFLRCRRLLQPGGVSCRRSSARWPRTWSWRSLPRCGRQEGDVESREGRSADGELLQGGAGVWGVPAAHRPMVSAGRDR
jgi:threonine dehydrogenase-like Zn-dependent dehydrogenase